MSVLIQGDQLRTILEGVKVDRATALPAAGSLFTITGGRVLIKAIVGKVTTAVTVADAGTKLVYNPTATGASVDLCAVLDLGTTDSAVGAYLTITGVVANAMRSTLLYATGRQAELILETGAIELSTGATDGSIAWTVLYVPLDNGASVVAA
ncbi:hypothetical protein [Nonomuraea insulae]|uniref:Uncharacterized protein n=1 Tax=Nonomuraea insulae TaxID=1616787 RepID=A0ABW1D9Z2_9ACTN